MKLTDNKDGGSAFPSHGSMGEVEHRGMSLRDWFAGQILTGAASSAQDLGSMKRTDRAALFKLTSELIYEIADAMLAERAKRNGTDGPA